MATHASAEKRNRQNIKREARNTAVESHLKTLRKNLLKCKSKNDAAEHLRAAISAFAKAAQKGSFHRNTAARRISSLQRFVNQLS